jgi:hypothetical protein
MRIFFSIYFILQFLLNAYSQEEGVYYRVFEGDTVKLALYGNMYIETGLIGLMHIKDMGTYIKKNDTLILNSAYNSAVCSFFKIKDSTDYEFIIIGFSESDDISELFDVSIIELTDSTNNIYDLENGLYVVLKSFFVDDIYLQLPDKNRPGKYVVSVFENTLTDLFTVNKNEILIFKNGNLYDQHNKEFRRL